MQIKHFFFFFLLIFTKNTLFSQVKILFDATKAESAGNADWVIDADTYNVSYGGGNPSTTGSGTEANAQRFPSPAQSTVTAATPLDYWKGALSSWAIESVKAGYQVETLPIGSQITYGNTGNAQDLSNYKIFVVCEPNILFTAAQKTAILSYVQNGGNLVMIGNHDGSDRNFDGADPLTIWNDLMTGNPFGITFDVANFSQTSSNVANLPGNPILNGAYGNVTKIQYAAGTSMTLDPTKNPNVKGLIFKTGASTTGNVNVMAATSVYGQGKIFAVGDSSPSDDGNGDTGDTLYDGWIEDADGNHRKMFMNVMAWMATSNVTPLSLSFSNQENVKCKGQKTGKATANVSGGTSPYTYLWSNNTTSNILTNVGAGVYTVTVSGGGIATASVTITEPPALTISTSSLPVTCKYDGSATAAASGGVTPYTYLWSNNATSASVTTPNSLALSVTVTDVNQCKSVGLANIVENKMNPEVNLVSKNGKVCGETCLTATPTIPNQTFSYSWSNGTTKNEICVIGAYMVTLSLTNMFNGCKNTLPLSILPPKTLSTTIDKITNASNGQKNGGITILVFDGTAPYIYEWKNSVGNIVANTKDLNNVAADTYILKVTDAQGCSISVTETIKNTVSVKDIDNQSLVTLYPNPANEFFFIDFKNDEKNKVQVFDLNGRLIFNEKIKSNEAVDVKNWTKGFYIVKTEGKVLRLLVQ